MLIIMYDSGPHWTPGAGAACIDRKDLVVNIFIISERIRGYMPNFAINANAKHDLIFFIPKEILLHNLPINSPPNFPQLYI